MPYTDAAYEADHDQFPDWHVYLGEEVPDTDPDTAAVAEAACGERLLGTGHLTSVKAHSREEFFDSLRPSSLAAWLSHPSVCTECRMRVAAEYSIEDEVREHLRRRDK